MLPYVDEETIHSLLDYEALIPRMESALTAFSAGRVAQPVREMLDVAPHGGHFAAMPAAGEVGMGAKLVSFFPGNAARQLPTHLALIVLFSPETGEPLAIMDGRLITEMRTAAVSAVATRALSDPGAEVLAILGSGVQARSHVAALRLVRRFREVRVWSRTRAHAERLAAEIGAQATTAEAAVRDADVIVTATSSLEPVLAGAWLKPGAHVNAVGWRGPAGRELDDEAMRHIVIVDSREAVMKESGDVLLSGAKIHAELGEVLAGTRGIARGSTTIFESVGMAVEDVAAAMLVYERLHAG